MIEFIWFCIKEFFRKKVKIKEFLKKHLKEEMTEGKAIIGVIIALAIIYGLFGDKLF